MPPTGRPRPVSSLPEKLGRRTSTGSSGQSLLRGILDRAATPEPRRPVAPASSIDHEAQRTLAPRPGADPDTPPSTPPVAMPTPESAAFLAKKPTVPPSFDGVDYDDTKRLKQAQDAIIREQWVKVMMGRLVREELSKCYYREGVNHLEKCGHLRGQFSPIRLPVPRLPSLPFWWGCNCHCDAARPRGCADVMASPSTPLFLPTRPTNGSLQNGTFNSSRRTVSRATSSSSRTTSPRTSSKRNQITGVVSRCLHPKGSSFFFSVEKRNQSTLNLRFRPGGMTTWNMGYGQGRVPWATNNPNKPEVQRTPRHCIYTEEVVKVPQMSHRMFALYPPRLDAVMFFGNSSLVMSVWVGKWFPRDIRTAVVLSPDRRRNF